MLEITMSIYLPGLAGHLFVMCICPKLFYKLKLDGLSEYIAYAICWPIISLILIVMGIVNVITKAILK